MTTHGRIPAIVAALVAAVALAAGCGGEEEPTAGGGEAAAGETTTIRFLQPLPESAAFYPYIVGQALGYFEEEGVEVELLPSGDVPENVLVQSGQADIASTTAASIFNGLEEGADYNIIYEYYQVSAQGIVVPEESDIQSIEDLEGRTIGLTSERAGDEALVNAALAAVGLPPDAVNKVVVGESGPIIVQGFESGDIDAFSGAINDFVGIEAAGIGVRNVLPEELRLIPASSDISRPEWYEANEEAVGGFLRAWAKATYAGMHNFDAAAAMAQEAVPEEWQTEEAGRALLDLAVELNTPVTEQFGELRPDNWERVLNQLKEGGEIAEDFTPEDFLDDRFIDDANDWDRAEVEQEIDQWAEENA